MSFGFATQQLLKMPAPESPQKVSDEKVLTGAADRTTKVKTAPFLEPKGKYANKAAVLEAFDQSVAKIAAYVKSTQDDLRGHGARRLPRRLPDAAHPGRSRRATRAADRRSQSRSQIPEVACRVVRRKRFTCRETGKGNSGYDVSIIFRTSFIKR
jgi:hypothetical protein